jgi:CelD/BcsL family acetyltransferase involved in cellulose biosynthesis
VLHHDAQGARAAAGAAPQARVLSAGLGNDAVPHSTDGGQERARGAEGAVRQSTTPPAVVHLREALPAEVEAWDKLVTRFENHRVVHTRAWIRSLEDSGYGRPLYLVFEKNGAIVGCLPGLLVSLGPLRLFGSPLPGWQTVSMGPAFDPVQVSTAEMLMALVPFLERRHGVHYIEILSSALDPESMRRLGFRGERAGSYRARLFPSDEEKTLRGLKENARRNIRRGIKLGLVVRFEDDERFVDEHYDQIKEVFHRGGNAVPFGRKRVLAYFRHMRAAGHMKDVSVNLPDGQTSIATGLFTLEGKELLLWMWAHRTRYRWYRPTELMTWTVMKRALAEGGEVFDLMGGRGDFKTKFGAVLDDSKYRWVRSRYRLLILERDVGVKGFRWQHALRGRVAWLASRFTSVEAGADDPPRGPGGAAASDHEGDS